MFFVLVIAVAVLLAGLAHLWHRRRRQSALLRGVKREESTPAR